MHASSTLTLLQAMKLKERKEQANELKKSLQSSLSDLQSQATLLEAQIAETTAKLKYAHIRMEYLWLAG